MTALNERALWFSDLMSLNDPMEGYYRTADQSESASELLTHDFKAFNETTARLGVCCLTDTPSSAPFWGLYAGEAAGFCIEFDVECLLKSLPETVSLVRMYYSDEPPQVAHHQGMEPHLNAKKILSHKHRAWEHEREWRLIAEATCKIHYTDDAAVSAIHLGNYAEQEAAQKLGDFCAKRKIPLKRMIVDGYTIRFQ